MRIGKSEELLIDLAVVRGCKAPGACGIIGGKIKHPALAPGGMEGVAGGGVLPGAVEAIVGAVDIELGGECPLVIAIIGVKINSRGLGETVLEIGNGRLAGVGSTGRARVGGQFVDGRV